MAVWTVAKEIPNPSAAITPYLPVKYVPISNDCQPWVSRLYWRKNHTFTEDERIFKNFIEDYYLRQGDP